jgi:hypothetical protein
MGNITKEGGKRERTEIIINIAVTLVAGVRRLLRAVLEGYMFVTCGCVSQS